MGIGSRFVWLFFGELSELLLPLLSVDKKSPVLISWCLEVIMRYAGSLGLVLKSPTKNEDIFNSGTLKSPID